MAAGSLGMASAIAALLPVPSLAVGLRRSTEERDLVGCRLSGSLRSTPSSPTTAVALGSGRSSFSVNLT